MFTMLTTQIHCALLLSGEVLVGHAPNANLVLHHSPSADEPPGTISGTLFVTNHRFAFVPPSPFSLEKVRVQANSHISNSGVLIFCHAKELCS